MNKTLRVMIPCCFAVVGFLLVAGVFWACNQPFDATGPVDQHLVVFTILSTDRNTQFVRVTAPFLPVAYDPATKNTIDNSVSDASVDIQTMPYYAFDSNHRGYYVQGQRLRLRDTVLIRPDSDGHQLPFHVYAISPFTPDYGKKYDVYVGSPSHGQAWGSVTIPKKPKLTLPYATRVVLTNPQQYEVDTPIKLLMTLADSVKGYVSRLFLDYSVVKDGEWMSERVEVPVSSVDPASYTLAYPIYPGLTQSAATNYLSAEYRNGYLRSVVKQITDVIHAGEKIIFDRVTFMVLQVDPNLYSYYAAGQLERDPRSIRLDQPAVARLNGGGYGLVGGYTADSLVYLLPEYYYANNR
jgi:hypothetical protein